MSGKPKTKPKKQTSPKPKKFEVELANGRRAIVTILDRTISTVDRKVNIWGANIRKKDGSILKVPVPVPATIIQITIGGKKLLARSCCKPPDIFDRDVGRRYALIHLFAQDANKSFLSIEDRDAVMRHMCPSFFKKVTVS